MIGAGEGVHRSKLEVNRTDLAVFSQVTIERSPRGPTTSAGALAAARVTAPATDGLASDDAQSGR